MRRTQIQLDEDVYRAVRDRAHAMHRSMASIIRDTLAAALDVRHPRRLTLEDFPFVGVGRSGPSRSGPVSEHHDAALVEAFAPTARHRR